MPRLAVRTEGFLAGMPSGLRSLACSYTSGPSGGPGARPEGGYLANDDTVREYSHEVSSKGFIVLLRYGGLPLVEDLQLYLDLLERVVE